MTNNPIRRLKLYLSMMRYGNAHNRDFANEHYQFFTTMQRNLQKYGVADLHGLRVLDVGCGKMFWLTLLLHSYGANATGIDTEFVESAPSLGKYASLLFSNGPERALRTLVWDSLYAPSYYKELAKVSELPLKFDKVDARRASVTELEFPDNTFDLVVSHEVFEHLPDIPAAVRALQRVMKPNAVTYIYVHNFASISGGHHIAWKYPDTEPSTVVPPWDHLRDNRYPDIPSWINGLRERDYRQAFEVEFDVLDWFPTATEGEALLTPEVQVQLSEYSEHELLTKGFVIIARPKKLQNRDAPCAQSEAANQIS